MDHEKLLQEQRGETRYRANLSAVVTAVNGDVVPVKITNISHTGVQLTSPQAYLPLFLPNSARSDQHKPQEFDIEFMVQTTTREEELVCVTCQILYLQRTSKNECLVGCIFCEMDNQVAETLMSYITHFAEPL